MTQYQRISDSGFVIGVFDPDNDHEDVVDGIIDDGHYMTFTKAGSATPTSNTINWDKLLSTEKGSLGGYLVGRQEARAKRTGETTGLSNFRRKRVERVKRAQIRAKTKLPASAHLIDALPTTVRGKAALASVPVAALAYTNRDRISAKTRAAQDVRRNRPASLYYDSGFGKAAEEIIKGRPTRRERKAAKLKRRAGADEIIHESIRRSAAAKRGPLIPKAPEKADVAIERALRLRGVMPKTPAGQAALAVGIPASILATSQFRKAADEILSKAGPRKRKGESDEDFGARKKAYADKELAAKTPPKVPQQERQQAAEAKKTAAAKPVGKAPAAVFATGLPDSPKAPAGNPLAPRRPFDINRVLEEQAAPYKPPAAAPDTGASSAVDDARAKLKTEADTPKVKQQGPWKHPAITSSGAPKTPPKIPASERLNNFRINRIKAKAERVGARAEHVKRLGEQKTALETARTAAKTKAPSTVLREAGTGAKKVFASPAAVSALNNAPGAIAIGGALAGGIGALAHGASSRRAAKKALIASANRKSLGEGAQLALAGGAGAGVIGASELARRRREAAARRPDFAGLAKEMTDEIDKANPLKLLKRGAKKLKPDPSKGTIGERVAEASDQLADMSTRATRTSRNARQIAENARYIIGGKYAPQTGKQGLSTGQMVGIGAAGVGGLMLGRNLAGPKPYPYQQQKA